MKTKNHLQNQTSPYLKQHMYNPIDWYPWGEEALQKSKNEDKPLFISIGYSTCHWCHVMAKESFENKEVAYLLNNYFVPIKVDREERPDIDSIYMNFCQIITGRGGWPLSIFALPNQKPFFVGTYFPLTSQFGHLGFIDILNNIINSWKKQKNKIIENSEKVYANMNMYKNMFNKKENSHFSKENYKKAINKF